MNETKKDRRTRMNTPTIDFDLLCKIKGAKRINDIDGVYVLPGTVDEDIFYRVCEGYAHHRWKTPYSRQNPRIVGIFETKIEAQRELLKTQWLTVKEPGKVRCAYIQRSCDGGKTWRRSQLMTVVSQ